jgi:hypothetical protein
MGWRQNPVVKWGAHLVGLGAATWGYALQEPVAVATFGAYLVFEFLLLDDKVSGSLSKTLAQMVKVQEEMSESASGSLDTMHRIQTEMNALADRNLGSMGSIQAEMNRLAKRIEDKLEVALDFDYLNGATAIWDRALDFLNHAQPKDKIKSTATFLNDSKFEKDILDKVFHGDLTYLRVVCFDDVDSKDLPGDIQLPAFEPTRGKPTLELLEAYHAWYQNFLASIESAKKHHIDDRVENVAMRTWFEALKKIETNRFKVCHYKAKLPSDYFVLDSVENASWKAVIGFERQKGQRMQSGFATTNSLLASDFGDTVDRLWEEAQKAAAAGRATANTARA